MISLVFSLAMAAQSPSSSPSPAAAAAKHLRVLVLDLKAVGVTDGEAALLRDAVVSRMGRNDGLEIISSAEVKTLVDIEAQKQANGCDTSAGGACLAELAGALGADYVVAGNVGKLGESVVLNLTMLEAKSAQAKARITVTGDSLDDVLARVGPEVDKLSSEIGSAPREISPLTYAGAGVGVVGAGVLVVGAGWTAILQSTLGNPVGKPADKEAALQQRIPALTTLGVGAAATVAGVAILAVSLVE